MSQTFSFKNAEASSLLAGLLLATAFYAQASGPGGGIASGMSGASEGQAQVLSGQSSSAGGQRAPPAAGQPVPPEIPGDRGVAGKQGARNKGLSGDDPDYSQQQGTDAGRVSGRNTNSPSVPRPLGASPGSEVGR
jgi:hypothetical protein